MVAGDFAQNAGLKVGPRGHRVQCALRGRAGVMSGGKQWSNDESFVAAKQVQQHGQKFAVDGSLTRFFRSSRTPATICSREGKSRFLGLWSADPMQTTQTTSQDTAVLLENAPKWRKWGHSGGRT